MLTIAAHADCDALLEATVLAAVPVDAQDGALLVLGAGTVLDLLLDAAAEEPLCPSDAGMLVTVSRSRCKGGEGRCVSRDARAAIACDVTQSEGQGKDVM